MLRGRGQKRPLTEEDPYANPPKGGDYRDGRSRRQRTSLETNIAGMILSRPSAAFGISSSPELRTPAPSARQVLASTPTIDPAIPSRVPPSLAPLLDSALSRPRIINLPDTTSQSPDLTELEEDVHEKPPYPEYESEGSSRTLRVDEGIPMVVEEVEDLAEPSQLAPAYPWSPSNPRPEHLSDSLSLCYPPLPRSQSPASSGRLALASLVLLDAGISTAASTHKTNTAAAAATPLSCSATATNSACATGSPAAVRPSVDVAAIRLEIAGYGFAIEAVEQTYHEWMNDLSEGRREGEGEGEGEPLETLFIRAALFVIGSYLGRWQQAYDTRKAILEQMNVEEDQARFSLIDCKHIVSQDMRAVISALDNVLPLL